MSSFSTVPVKDYCISNGFTNIVKTVRINSNNLPYLTFIKVVDGKNVGENIYFSKAGSKLVDEGVVIDKELMSKFSIGETTNAEGEKRIKLCTQGEGNWASVEELF